MRRETGKKCVEYLNTVTSLTVIAILSSFPLKLCQHQQFQATSKKKKKKSKLSRVYTCTKIKYGKARIFAK